MITRTTILSHRDGDSHVTITGTPSQVEYLQARIQDLFATKEQPATSGASSFEALFSTFRRDR